MKKTPLSWLNLTHDLRRLATSLTGVGFAVVLIFTELGFLNALLGSTVEPIRRFQADSHPSLVMIHADKETLVDSYRFGRRWLVEAESFPEVEWARPVYFESGLSSWHNPVTGKSRHIRVITSDSEEVLAMIAGPSGSVDRLGQSGSALFDLHSKSSFGYSVLPRERADDRPEGDGETDAVISRNQIRLVGHFELGTDFVNDGNMIVSQQTFHDLFPTRRVFKPDVPTIDVGVIRLVAGANPEAVRDKMAESLNADKVGVRILTTDQMIEVEQTFWRKATPVGPIFLLGVILGFVVGVVICFQVLSSDIRDHLAEYATLKAIGYGNSYLVKLVFRQAFWLAVLGFVPSLAFANGLYALLRSGVGLPMKLDWWTVSQVFAMTIIMCLSSAYLAIRKLFKADPAELFR